MGCVFGRHCDPGVPDPSVRYKWHVDCLILDDGHNSEIRRGGLVYIQDEAIRYRPRRFDCSKIGGAYSVEIANVQNTSKGKTYTDERSHQQIKRNIIWIEVHENDINQTLGLVTIGDVDKIYDDICDIISKHRQKPRIVQYNSVDIDGVEIEPM
ncbi:unnamed protein product [Caenorhabditis bovis]|uniref:Uncharacterized protein n=1 Tax=Caenorhabditis bovis TaxID=2654633 RepID=A0A8S1EBT2_9PELO|nr:unnamed protein product [Caenorhabditis bovis]